MFNLVVLLSLIGYALGTAILDQERRANTFPYQAGIQISNIHICAGSVLNSMCVLTAAHCLDGVRLEIQNLEIRAGSTSKISGGAVIQVSRIISHPQYDSFSLDYDVAIIVLNTALPLGPNIIPIKMATASPRDGLYATETGWNFLNLELQDVEVKVASTDECSSGAFNYGNKIKSSMFCGTIADKNNYCQQDSGSPLTVGGVQFGIALWGPVCESSKYPRVYTNVALIQPWIESTAKKYEE